MAFYNGDIRFRGVSSKSFPLTITSPPQVTHPEVRVDTFVIPGRDGELVSEDTYLGNAEIRVSFALVTSDTVTSYQQALRSIRFWLSGRGRLIIGDSTDSYYEVLKTSIVTDSRVIVRYGVLEVAFTVYPCEFMVDGDSAITSYATVNNPGDRAMPEYVIEGSGSGTLTVNGLNMLFTASSKITIDTRRQIAYDGNGNNMNGNLKGNYDNLYLYNGTNTISITSGFTLKIIPHWGYKL